MSDHWCSVCLEDADLDVRASGCGNTSCCFSVYELRCGCDGATIEYGDKPDATQRQGLGSEGGNGQ